MMGAPTPGFVKWLTRLLSDLTEEGTITRFVQGRSKLVSSTKPPRSRLPKSAQIFWAALRNGTPLHSSRSGVALLAERCRKGKLVER